MTKHQLRGWPAWRSVVRGRAAIVDGSRVARYYQEASPCCYAMTPSPGSAAGKNEVIDGGQQELAANPEYAYDDTFYKYIQRGATSSAQVVVPLVLQSLRIKSVLDVGCGAGAWLAEYGRCGVLPFLGVDGAYVQASTLLISPSTFVARDVGAPFDLGRRFDLAQCLEVGEHIEPAASRALVSNLVKHSELILFSAAVPGQGGENHINEQTYEFWRSLFAEHGYTPHDFLRPQLSRMTAVEIWYRHNILLYVGKGGESQLPPSVSRTRIPDTDPIPDVASVAYRCRTRLLAALPVRWVSQIAVLKHRSILLYSRMTKA